MRFNQKELAFIATRTDIPFDKEGVLWLKEKEGHFWQRNEGNYVTDDFTIKSAGSSLKLSQKKMINHNSECLTRNFPLLPCLV